MLEPTIAKAAYTLTREVKESPTYQEYLQQLERIKSHPELYDKVNEYRMKNFEMQNQEQSDDLFERIDSFQREYEDFIETPVVNQFLRAELTFCRMMQEVNAGIWEALDFE